MDMEKTIKVTGKGKLSVKPDRIHLFMTLQETNKTYKEALKKSSEQAEQLKKCFSKLGFKKEDFKTVSFQVNAKYESYKHNNVWKQRMIGYEFRQEFKLEFDLNNKLLGEVLYVLAHGSASPRFRIDYTVKDVEAAKNQLLAKAVADSHTKATVLTQAANVELGDILSIDYSWEEMELRYSPAAGVLSAHEELKLLRGAEEEESYQMDMEPDNIDITDTVTVIWEIK